MEKVQYVYHWNRIFGAIAGLLLLLATIAFAVYSLVATEKPSEPAEIPSFVSNEESAPQDHSQPSIKENPRLAIENQQLSDSSSISNSDLSSLNNTSPLQQPNNPSFDFAQFQFTLSDEKRVTELEVEDKLPPTVEKSDPFIVSDSDPSPLDGPATLQKSDDPSFDYAQFQPTHSDKKGIPVHKNEDKVPPTAAEESDRLSVSDRDPSSLQKTDNPSVDHAKVQPTHSDESGMALFEVGDESLPPAADNRQLSISREPIEKTQPEPDNEQLFPSENKQPIPLQTPESTATLKQSELAKAYTLQDSDSNRTFHLQEIKKFSPSVKRFTLARAITDREPIGTMESINMDSNGLAIVYAFSEIVGMKDQMLNYYWYHDEKRVAKVPIHIGSNRWRINSSKYINDKMQGTWSVELQTDNGQLLASAKFISGAQ